MQVERISSRTPVLKAAQQAGLFRDHTTCRVSKTLARPGLKACILARARAGITARIEFAPRRWQLQARLRCGPRRAGSKAGRRYCCGCMAVALKSRENSRFQPISELLGRPTAGWFP